VPRLLSEVNKRDTAAAEGVVATEAGGWRLAAGGGTLGLLPAAE
jgi:hypothetical protein